MSLRYYNFIILVTDRNCFTNLFIITILMQDTLKELLTLRSSRFLIEHTSLDDLLVHIQLIPLIYTCCCKNYNFIMIVLRRVALVEHTLTLMVRFFGKVRCVLLVTGVCV